MANVIINDTNLTNIANAIREKNGLTDTYKPSEMATAILAIQGGGTTEVEPIVLTGDCNYACAGVLAGAYIDTFGNSISTESIVNAARMFHNNHAKIIPFEINMDNTTYRNMGYMFYYCINLQSLPKINNAYPSNVAQIFSGCKSIVEIPNDYFDDWNWSLLQTNASAQMNGMFQIMSSLRRIPTKALNNLYGKQTSSSAPYPSLFLNDFALDEVIGLGVSTGANLQSNRFTNTFNSCYHIKDIIFQTLENGNPQSAIWNYQTIDLTNWVGYASLVASDYQDAFNRAGLTADKEVVDDITYQALKNDLDWWTRDINYSRYNHDSAVRTINSLPRQCNGCIIKFIGASGALTDGGAINTLTEEEIAVATSKGWTVSLV